MPRYGHHLDDRPRGHLSICVAVCLMLLCCGQDVEAQRRKPDRNPLSCVYRSIIHLHDDSWDEDECKRCSCDNGVVHCTLKEDPPVNCADEQDVEGTSRQQPIQPDSTGIDGREEAISNELPCVYRGTILLHGDTLNVDACTECDCNSGTVSCRSETCPETKSCKKPVIAEGECCPYCPNDLVVNSVIPKVRNKNSYHLYANRNNSLEVKVKVKFSDTASATEVTGKKLWGLGVWLSPNRDTGLPRYGYVDQILSDRQSSQNYLRDRKFSFRNVIYQFNDPQATCRDMKFICVELKRGASVKPGHFTLNGFTGESSLAGCGPAPKCKN